MTEGAEGAEGAPLAGTLLDAALDAAKGKPWPRQSPGGSATWWGTQGRQLAVAMRLCGVAPGVDEAVQLAQAAALQVEALLLREGAQSIAEQPGYRRRGQATVAVFERLITKPGLLRRVLAAGHMAGLWGAPWRWDAAGHCLRPWAFRGDGTRPP